MGKGGVILVSNKQARLKPCLRCGYSLRHIIGAKNCPECGLAVRVSLADNTGLEWSNPRWQRFLSMGFGVLALGLACRALSFAAEWIVYGAEEEYFQLSDVTLRVWGLLWRYAGEVNLIICGLALCLLAKGERRYPDKSRLVRGIALVAGMLIIPLGCLDAVTHHALWPYRSRWSRYLIWHELHGPWIAVVISISACSYAFYIRRRSGSRLLSRLLQVPLWPMAAGLIVWFLDIGKFFWPLPSIISDAAFPISMIVMLVAAIWVLLSGAREAELNWVTDP